MALAFAPNQAGDSATNIALASGWFLVCGTITFSGSYSTGGESLDLTKYISVGGKLRHVVCLVDIRGNDGEYDLTNKKLKLYSAANTEVAAAAYNAAITATPVQVAFLVKIT